MNKINAQKAVVNHNLNEIIAILTSGKQTSAALAETMGVDKTEVLAAVKTGMSGGSIRKTKDGFAGPVVYELSAKAQLALARAAETNPTVSLAPVPSEVAPSPTLDGTPAPKVLIAKRGISYAVGYLDQMAAAYTAELPIMPGVEREYIGRRFLGLLGEGYTVAQARTHLARYVRSVAEHTAQVIASVATPASEEDVAAFVDNQRFARVASLD